MTVTDEPPVGQDPRQHDDLGPDRYARQRVQAEAAETADFDAWRARQAPTTVGITLAGRTFRLPKQAPLAYTLETERFRRNRHRMTTDDLRKLVGMLFGPDGLDHLVDNGYDHDDLGILVMWGSANLGSPVERVSLDEAAEFYARAERGEQVDNPRGKASPPPVGGQTPGRKRAKRKRGRRSSGTGR